MTIKDESTQASASPKVGPDPQRRLALRRIGLRALAVLSGSALVGQVLAVQKPPKPPGPGPRPPLTNLESIRASKLSALQASQLQALKLTKRAPPSTSITQLGLTNEGISKLTAPARRLTKSDLEALGRADMSNPRVSALTVEDIASIRVAFGTAYRPGASSGGGLAAADVSCCCCTPCCCAAAVAPSLKLAA